ncbi:MAG: hypothetical protein R3B09_24935 [Nannocystaceae bacterium]
MIGEERGVGEERGDQAADPVLLVVEGVLEADDVDLAVAEEGAVEAAIAVGDQGVDGDEGELQPAALVVADAELPMLTVTPQRVQVSTAEPVRSSTSR